jgi:hypothetical protein
MGRGNEEVVFRPILSQQNRWLRQTADVIAKMVLCHVINEGGPPGLDRGHPGGRRLSIPLIAAPRGIHALQASFCACVRECQAPLFLGPRWPLSPKRCRRLGSGWIARDRRNTYRCPRRAGRVPRIVEAQPIVVGALVINIRKEAAPHARVESNSTTTAGASQSGLGRHTLCDSRSVTAIPPTTGRDRFVLTIGTGRMSNG